MARLEQSTKGFLLAKDDADAVHDDSVEAKLMLMMSLKKAK